MKYVCICYQGQVYQVIVEDVNVVCLVDGILFVEDWVEWLLLVIGSMFVFGLNYVDYVVELLFKVFSELLVFIKLLGIYIGYCQVSWCLDNVDYMYYECELVVVIGKLVCNVCCEDVFGYLVGYMVCNDYVICDYLENYYWFNLWVKNCDVIILVGLWIVDVVEVFELNWLVLCIWVNGELCQEGSIVDMIFDIFYLIEYFFSFMILQLGDMIVIGILEGLFDVVFGDEVVVEVEGVGCLVN